MADGRQHQGPQPSAASETAATTAPGAAPLGAAPDLLGALALADVERRAAVMRTLQRTCGNVAVTRLCKPLIQRAPPRSKPSAAAKPPAPIRGPLAIGEVRRDGDLVVEQEDAETARITYGDSSVTIRGRNGGRFAFEIDPPAPEEPERVGPSWEAATVADPDAPRELPQRVVRVTGRGDVRVNPHVDPTPRTPPLVVHERTLASSEEEPDGALFGPGRVIEAAGDQLATLQLDTSVITITAGPKPPGGRRGYAYWIDPFYSGEQGRERRVTIVAAPGVEVHSTELEPLVSTGFGRRLVEEVVRVPHPDLVPPQGARFTVEDFVGVQNVQPGPASPFGAAGKPGPDQLSVTTSLAGVTVTHPWSGAQVTFRVADRARGAAYAHQVLAPENGRPGEIRVVIGPGVQVEFVEPVPARLRSEDGATPTPRPGAARAGEGLEEHGIELTIVEVDDPATVPAQGVPLNMTFLLGRGRLRKPDTHRWADTSDAGADLATTGADVAVGMVPIVGDLADIGEFALALATDKDRWGRDVSTSDKVLMGLGAVIGLIPLLGGVGSALRRAPRATVRLLEAARTYRKTPEQLELVLLGVRHAVGDPDAALIRKALQAAESGAEVSAAELRRLQEIIARVGAPADGLRIGRRALEPTAESVEFAADEAKRGVLHDREFLSALVASVKSTDEVPEPLARQLSGAFGSGDETKAAVEQGLDDASRAGDLAIDRSFAEHVAESAGAKVDEILELKEPTRHVAVRKPELLAQYERLANAQMPKVVSDVLAAQSKRPTPPRRRLKELAERFTELRREVGAGEQLTDAQRTRAMTILREARKAARKDFQNVQRAIMRRLRKDPELAELERQLRAAGDISGGATGGIRIRTRTDEGKIVHEPANVEHLRRLSDNPWAYNDPANLVLTDAVQNQHRLEELRKHGWVWPTDDVERFVITHGLHDQAGTRAPGRR
jgi:hypothetical protein